MIGYVVIYGRPGEVYGGVFSDRVKAHERRRWAEGQQKFPVEGRLPFGFVAMYEVGADLNPKVVSVSVEQLAAGR